MTVAGSDLGVCGARLAGDRLCDGRLIVEREVGGILEAVCSRCGDVAGRPVGRVVAPAEEPDRDDEALW